MGGYEHLIPFGIFGFFGAIVAVAIGWHYYSEKKRREAMADAAYHLGLEFSPDASFLETGEFARFQVFNEGHSRKFKNVIKGEVSKRPVNIFDYQYTTGGGKNSTTHRATMAVFTLPKGDMPQFELRPEHIFHKIGAVFGYQDIDFDTHPEFSKTYLLRGKSEQDVRGLFRMDVLYHFESHPGWSVEGVGQWMVIYRANKRVDPEQLRAFVDDTQGIVSVFPL
ncbi:hypothetical protein ACFL2T_04335 [Elusimicrobiota bacterium]